MVKRRHQQGNRQNHGQRNGDDPQLGGIELEIGIRRLEARPTAELCIDCKTLAEIKEKQMAG